MVDSQTQYVYESGYISLGKLTKLMSHLRNAKIKSVKAHFECPDPSIIQMLKRSFEHKKKEQRIHENKSMLGKTDINFHEAKKKKFKKTIEFSIKLVIVLFINEYRIKLKQLADEYKLYMSWQGETIRVYSDFPISSIFESQIIQMKHRLKYVVFNDAKFFTKLKYSKIVCQRLKNKNIRYILLQRNNCFALHSSTIDNDQIINTKNQFAYDALVLEFTNQIFSPRVNRLFFRMMVYHLQPFLKQISQNYEIKSEISWKKMGVILHTRDPIFSSEPHQQLTKFLQNLVFVTYYTKNTTQHMMHIRKNKPKQKCLQFMMSDIFIYTCWNMNKEIYPKQVAKVFEKCIQQLSLNTVVRVSFKTGGRSLLEIQKVEELAEKYRLYTEMPYQNDTFKQLLHIKFKSFFNKKQKTDNFIRFLQELITGKTQDNQTSNQLKIVKQLEKSVISQLSSSSQEILEQQNQQQLKCSPPKSQLSEQKHQTRLPYFQYPFQKPRYTIQRLYKINKSKRNRKLQEYLEQKFNVVSKVWNVNVSIESQKFQNFEVQQQQKCHIYIKQKQQNAQILNHEKSICIQSLEIDKEYFLLSKIVQSQKCIITHIMEVYSK